MVRRSGYRVRSWSRIVFFAVLVLTLSAGGILWASGYLDDFLYGVGLTEKTDDPEGFKGRVNILLLGTDARKGEKMARTDTIMLASVDTEKKLVSILSIPRDTRVRIPGHGYEKINSATLYGGPSLAMRTISELLGIRVNSYVMMDYHGFKEIVDSLGGVTMDVKERMYHHDPQDGGAYTIDLRPGVQRLDGSKALQFVRYRGYALGDIERTGQQQEFVSALVKEVMQPSTVVKLPSMVASFSRAVETNLSFMEMQRLAFTAAKMTDASLLTQTLPGKFLNYDGGSYWEVDSEQARIVIASMYEGRAADKVVLGEKTVVSTDSQGLQDKPVSGQTSQTGVVKDAKTGTTSSGTTTGNTAPTSSKSSSTTSSKVTKTTTGSGTSSVDKNNVEPVAPDPPDQKDVEDTSPIVIIKSGSEQDIVIKTSPGL